jgi:hypothetical protein
MEKYRSVKISFFLCFFVLYVTHSGFTQTVLGNGMLLTISEDSIVCHHPCNDLQVTLTFRNISNYDIAVFGLPVGPQPAFGPLEELCDLSMKGTGTRFGVWMNNELLTPSWSISSKVFKTDEQNDSAFQATRARLDSLLREMKFRFLSSGFVLKKQQEKTYAKTVPLRDYELSPGRYRLQFCYYCGENTLQMPELKNVVEDKSSHLYQGCAISRSIVLVVK